MLYYRQLGKSQHGEQYLSVIHKNPICSQNACHDSVFSFSMTAITENVRLGYTAIKSAKRNIQRVNVMKALKSRNKSPGFDKSVLSISTLTLL